MRAEPLGWSLIMTPFRLELSDHAAARLKQRLITREQVRSCVAKETVLGFDLRGRVLCQARIDREDLVVVYIEIPQGVLVVTAYWKGTI